MLDDFGFGVGDLIHQPPLKWRDPRPLIWSSDITSYPQYIRTFHSKMARTNEEQAKANSYLW